MAARVFTRLVKRRDGRPPLWIQLAVIVWLLWLYDTINDLAPLRRALALHNAVSVINFEHSLGLSVELTLNHWLSGHIVLAYAFSYYYLFAHFFVTFGLLVWMWWRRSSLYSLMRNRLVIINVIGFVVFWRYPLAPPRMLSGMGFQNVITAVHAVGSFESGALASQANQYAAMPSLHVAWATWSAVALWRLTSKPLVRALALIYPIVTSIVVLGTGNHYLLDVTAGFGTALVSFAAASALERMPALARSIRRRRAPAVMTATSTKAATTTSTTITETT